MYCDSRLLRRAFRACGQKLLLYHRRLRGRDGHGHADDFKRVRHGGFPAAYRRDVPVRIERRVEHGLRVWGLLAFIKAADTRQNASVAIRVPHGVTPLPEEPDAEEDAVDEPAPEDPDAALRRPAEKEARR